MVRARHCTDQTAKVETRRGGLPGLQAAREISDTHPLLPVDALKHAPHRLVSTWTRWVHTKTWKDMQMFLINSFNLLLDGRRSDDSRSHTGGSTRPEFPEGQLTSAAWEGWWHEDAA